VKEETKPKLIKRTDKLPTKSQLKKMREKVIALSKKNKKQQQSLYEETPMKKKTEKTSGKETKSRKTLGPEDYIRMVEDWDNKTISEWAKEFDVSYQTILKMSQAINKENKTLCPPKPKKARTRADIAKATIALYKKKQDKK